MEPHSISNVRLLLLCAALISILVIAGAATYYFSGEEVVENEAPTVMDVPDVSADVSSAVEAPAERLPETNPYSTYKNPFE